VKLKANAPIGIFDSGIGGLTVAHSIHTCLPNEQIVYFGDTAHLPYGDKSESAIQAYSIKIADVLLKKGCKVIVIACNSASSSSTYHQCDRSDGKVCSQKISRKKSRTNRYKKDGTIWHLRTKVK
jgi:glutamate racemase